MEGAMSDIIETICRERFNRAVGDLVKVLTGIAANYEDEPILKPDDFYSPSDHRDNISRTEAENEAFAQGKHRGAWECAETAQQALDAWELFNETGRV
jgi:hypothetical protein